MARPRRLASGSEHGPDDEVADLFTFTIEHRARADLTPEEQVDVDQAIRDELPPPGYQ